MRSLTNVFHPDRFQGVGQQRGYFEGYYLKVVDPTLGLALALIPGVSYDEQGNGHAFVQVLDGTAGHATYHQFDLSTFAYAKTSFQLTIGPHRFGSTGCQVALPGATLSFSFRQNQPWPWKVYSPGAMGPFSFVPFMECKHGVVSLHHAVSGTYNGRLLSDAAVGYIEKDWGRSFPRSWIWLQSNHLEGETEPCCLMVSAGRVPWITGAFDGFIAALLWRGQLYRFTTYNGASMKTRFRESSVQLDFRKGKQHLHIVAHHAPGVDLVSPIPEGGMLGRVNESLQAHAVVEFRTGSSRQLSTTARWMGFEVGGTPASEADTRP